MTETNLYGQPAEKNGAILVTLGSLFCLIGEGFIHPLSWLAVFFGHQQQWIRVVNRS